VRGRRGRWCKQLLDDRKEKKEYWKLKKEALDRSLWRTRYGRGYGPVVRLTTEWWWVATKCCWIIWQCSLLNSCEQARLIEGTSRVVVWYWCMVHCFRVVNTYQREIRFLLSVNNSNTCCQLLFWRNCAGISKSIDPSIGCNWACSVSCQPSCFIQSSPPPVFGHNFKSYVFPRVMEAIIADKMIRIDRLIYR